MKKNSSNFRRILIVIIVLTIITISKINGSRNASALSRNLSCEESCTVNTSLGKEVSTVNSSYEDIPSIVNSSCKENASTVISSCKENITSEANSSHEDIVSEVMSTEESTSVIEKETSNVESLKPHVESDYVIDCTEEEVDLIVQLVLHEVGDNSSYFHGDDINLIQQCIAACVVNRTASSRFPDTVTDVLTQPGQFLDLQYLERFDAENEVARQNVLRVLTGNSSIPETLVFEMGFWIHNDAGDCIYSPEEALELARKQLGSVELFYSTYSVEGCTCLFLCAGR